MRNLLYILPLFILASTFTGNPPGWYELMLPINDQVNDIYFTDSLNGWIVTKGDNSPPDTGYILHTSDGGSNWEVQFSHVGDFAAIQFLDNNTGYAYGFVGFTRFYKTTDGGVNWINLSGGVPLFGADDMQFLNKDTGWICSNDPVIAGGIAKTTNGGINWVQQLGTTERPHKLFFIDANTGWALGSNNNLYKTVNGGNIWNIQYGFIQSIHDIFIISQDTGWILGTGDFGSLNGIFKTTNGGINWNRQQDPDPSFSACLKLFFIDNKTGWISCGFGSILKTTDGINWGIQYPPSGNYFTIQSIDSSISYAGGTKMIKTTDGGGPVSSIQLINNEIPVNFELYQNYPNPFNPTTYIKFNIKQSGFVKLNVFDIAGKEVDVLVNAELSIGEYEYKFDGTGLSSGIYFYRIQTKAFTDIKKMILVK